MDIGRFEPRGIAELHVIVSAGDHMPSFGRVVEVRMLETTLRGRPLCVIVHEPSGGGRAHLMALSVAGQTSWTLPDDEVAPAAEVTDG